MAGGMSVCWMDLNFLHGLIQTSDYVLEDMLNSAGRPELLFLDLRPVNYPMIAVASHEIAEQITRTSKLYPMSVTKSPTMQISYRRLIGKKSLLSEDVNHLLFLSSPSPPTRKSKALSSRVLVCFADVNFTGRLLEDSPQALQSRLCPSASNYAASTNLTKDVDFHVQT